MKDFQPITQADYPVAPGSGGCWMVPRSSFSVHFGRLHTPPPKSRPLELPGQGNGEKRGADM